MPKLAANERRTHELERGDVVQIDSDPHYVVIDVRPDPSRSDRSLYAVSFGHEINPARAHSAWLPASHVWTLAPDDRPMPGGTR